MKGETSKDETPKGLAANRYSAGEADRTPFLSRARLNASLTDASLFTWESTSEGNTGQDIAQPWTSLGAYLINNLTSKVTLVLFPVGLSFVRFEASRKVLATLVELDETARGQAKTAISTGLTAVEQELVKAIAADGDHTVHTLTVKRLIVGGNHCHEHLPDGKIRGVPLDRFVTWRDRLTELVEFVIMDVLAYETLTDDVKAILQANGHSGDACQKGAPEKNIKVYTHGRLKDGKWKVYQEVWGQVVPETEFTWTKEALPFKFLGINFLEGENYSRAYVDSYVSDLQMFDGLSEIVYEGSAAAALYIRLVRAGSTTNKKALAEARNGTVLTGDKDDVHTLDANKTADFRTAQEIRGEAGERLARAFLLNSTVQRQGDRVTREEIRFVAQELQDILGGVYMSLVTSYQAPYAETKLRVLQKVGRVTKFPRDQVDVTILTGAAALGRNAELNNLDALVAPPSTNPNAPPPPVHWDEYYARKAVLLGQDAEGLIKTREEVTAEQQAAQQAQMAQQVAPEVVRQVGQGLQNNQKADLEMAAATAEQGAPV